MAAKRKPAKAAKPKPIKATKRKPVKVAKRKPAKPKPIKATKRKPAKVAKHKPAKAAAKRRSAKIRAIEQLSIGAPIVTRELQSSNWSHHFDSAKLPEIFTNVLKAHARKGPFEPQDILVFNHGIKFLGHRPLTLDLSRELSKTAAKGALVLKTVETKIGTEIYVFMGDKPKIQSGVEHSLLRRQKYLQAIYDKLSDFWGQLDWWLWFETETSLYE